MHITEKSILTSMLNLQFLTSSRYHTEETKAYTEELERSLEALLSTEEGQRATAWLREFEYLTEFNIPTDKATWELNDFREVGNKGLSMKIYSILGFAAHKTLYNTPITVLDKTIEQMNDTLFNTLLAAVTKEAGIRFATKQVDSEVFENVTDLYQNQAVISDLIIEAEANLIEDAEVPAPVFTKKKSKV